MIVLGLSGCFNTGDRDMVPNLPPGFYHDAAAVLIEDGEVLAALEEERVVRIKHTNRFPAGAVAECLEVADLGIRDVDRIAFFFEEGFTDLQLGLQYVRDPRAALTGARAAVVGLIQDHFNVRLDPSIIHFVSHHTAHAASTYLESGWERALVAVFDGNGERESGSILRGDGEALRSVSSYPAEVSLGHFYAAGTRMLGFGDFDEYKVMGLAPYGDPERFWKLFSSVHELGREGAYKLDVEGFERTCLVAGIRPKRSREALTQEHRDFAAGLQQVLERVSRHILSHWQRVTGETSLCLAGGVAHNSSMNGALARAGIFEKVFVHPAAHDAGAALGAALWIGRRAQSSHRPSGGRRRSVALGPVAGSPGEVASLLRSWAAFVAHEVCENVCERAASAIADGAIVGWVQGRSEFGPRALGNRSILADPRPRQNRERINAVVKRREDFRPFAPAVIEEAAHDYFELAEAIEDPEFMAFVVPVRPDRREVLGAVTHVNGSARVQLVNRAHAPRFWQLIDEFGRRSGVPVLLNTSFNNYAEPIVQTAFDALRCFLTAELDYLFLGDILVRRVRQVAVGLGELAPELGPQAALWVRTETRDGRKHREHSVAFGHPGGRTRRISSATYRALDRSDGRTTLRVLTGGEVTQEVEADVLQLWQDRLINLTPE